MRHKLTKDQKIAGIIGLIRYNRKHGKDTEKLEKYLEKLRGNVAR